MYVRDGEKKTQKEKRKKEKRKKRKEKHMAINLWSTNVKISEAWVAKWYHGLVSLHWRYFIL